MGGLRPDSIKVCDKIFLARNTGRFVIVTRATSYLAVKLPLWYTYISKGTDGTFPFGTSIIGRMTVGPCCPSQTLEELQAALPLERSLAKIAFRNPATLEFFFFFFFSPKIFVRMVARVYMSPYKVIENRGAMRERRFRNG